MILYGYVIEFNILFLLRRKTDIICKFLLYKEGFFNSIIFKKIFFCLYDILLI